MTCGISFKEPVGILSVITDGEVITRIIFGELSPDIENTEIPLLRAAREQFDEYFGGKRQTFDLPYRITGNPLSIAVLSALEGIPYGETVSYGGIAKQIGRPGAARAVGRICHDNPLPIIIPCHRVTAADGSLRGYSGGLDIKAQLLKIEGKTLI